MKIKNINSIEQHVEKLVLGIAVVACLVGLWLFVLTPYTVKLGREDVAVNRVEQQVRKSAEGLKTQMATSQDIPEFAVKSYSESFDTRNRRPFLAEATVAKIPLGKHGLDPASVKRVEQAKLRFVLADPPAPFEMKARKDYFVLMARPDLIEEIRQQRQDDEEIEATRNAHAAAAEFAKLVDETAPRDFQEVTVMGRFDLEAWAKILEEQRGPNRIPASWWQGKLLLTDVVLERQMRDLDTGRWPDAKTYETVPPLPGSVSFREHHDPNRQWEPYEVRELLDEIRFFQNQIAQPAFAPVTEARYWLPPDEQEAELDAEQVRRLFTINRQLEQKRKQLLNVMLKQEKLEYRRQQEQDRQQDVSTSRRRRGGRGVGPDDEDPNRRTRKKERPVRRSRRDDEPGDGRRRERVERTAVDPSQKLAEENRFLTEDIQDLMMKKDELLYPQKQMDPDGLEVMEGRRTADGRMRRPRPGRLDGLGTGRLGQGGLPPELGGIIGRRPQFDQLEDEEEMLDPMKVMVWAHDLTVKEGVTYRYRLRVRVLNPMFQQQRLVAEQKAIYGNLLGLMSMATEWSEPVPVDPEQRFFVVGADRVNRRATVEVYRIFNGRRRMERFTISPGDPIGGTVPLEDFDGVRMVRTEMDMRVPGVAVDVAFRMAGHNVAGSSSVLMYYDQKRNRLAERSVEVDRSDEHRQRLNVEVTRDAEAMTLGPDGNREHGPSDRLPRQRGRRRGMGMDPGDDLY